jgi:hypothetical protein
LKQRRFRHAKLKLAVTSSLAVVVALAVFGPAIATGSSAGASGSTANTVLIEGSRKSPLKFVYPKTIVSGEELTIENKTNPKAVGPHTFSMVEESEFAETATERKKCFTPGHICMAIAKWHGVKGKGPVTVDPAKAGKPGWDTEGSLSKTGDSWFTGEKPGTSYTQKVTADTSNGPTTITFMCAIHPWMHGSIEVLPGS